MPVLVAPVAYQRMVASRGRAGDGRGAAAAAGTVMCLSTLATTRPRRGRRGGARRAGRWFQLYAFRDDGVTRALMDEAVEAGFEAIVVTVDAPPRRQPRARPAHRLHAPAGARRRRASTAALGVERAVTIERDLRADGPRARPGPTSRTLASECRRAGPGQGRPHRRGRRAGGRARRRRRRRLQPRRPPARPLRSPPPTPCRRWSRRSPAGPRSSSTAASAAASTSRSRWPSAPTRSWSAGPPSGASRPAARRGRRRVLELLREELELALGALRLHLAGRADRAHVRRAPAASVYSV